MRKTKLINRIYKEKRKESALLRWQAYLEARKIARILGKKFGAERVVLFGSLARRNSHFDIASDIDLAAQGLGGHFFRAYGYCARAGRFNLDLKSYEDMPEYFKDKIEQEGSVLYEKKHS